MDRRNKLHGFEKLNIYELNNAYETLTPIERIDRFYREFGDDDVLCTSSFGVYSACLLVLISKVNSRQKIHFIDTGNHFLETHSYRAQLSNVLDLKVESISASPDVHYMARKHELWKINAEYCCHIKKVKPLLQLKQRYAFWITGLQKWQTVHRSTMNVLEKSDGMIKFNPLIDLSRSECDSIMENYSVPQHPLLKFGFESVGCIQCTTSGDSRNGRWPESNKTECGLHYK